MPRRPNGAAVMFPRDFSRATDQAVRILIDAEADAVVGFGGYASTPVYRAARKAELPVVVHEAERAPGVRQQVRRVLRCRGGHHLPWYPAQECPSDGPADALGDISARRCDGGPCHPRSAGKRCARCARMGGRRPRAACHRRFPRRGEPQRRDLRGGTQPSAPRHPHHSSHRHRQRRGCAARPRRPTCRASRRLSGGRIRPRHGLRPCSGVGRAVPGRSQHRERSHRTAAPGALRAAPHRQR